MHIILENTDKVNFQPDTQTEKRTRENAFAHCCRLAYNEGMQVQINATKTVLCCTVCVGLLLLLGCTAKQDRTAQSQFAEAAPSGTAAPDTTASSIATAMPTATALPTPAPTAEPLKTPMITDDWYVDRTQEMRARMEEFGGYTGAALDSRVAAMEIDPNRPMIALTFDDGPMEGITDAIVKILAHYDSRATFFIRGSRMKYEETPELLKKILGEGNELGNHTWGHEILARTNGKVIMDTLQKTNAAVLESTGYTMHLMRPPGGYSSAAVRRMAKRFELAVVLWAQSGNVHEQDPAKIAQNVQCQIVNGKELENGDIVLLHDTKPWMVEAVGIMVPALLEQGYQLVTVSELLSLSPRGIVYGEVYHKQIED